MSETAKPEQTAVNDSGTRLRSDTSVTRGRSGPVRSIAERMFDGFFAESELGEELVIEYERIGFDHYDNSLELYGVPDDARLSIDEQKVIHAAGFSKCYVNHVDKWETHYGFHDKEFKPAKGWRVSYPHKRGDETGGILVEEICPSWPKDWFETGYCRVVP